LPPRHAGRASVSIAVHRQEQEKREDDMSIEDTLTAYIGKELASGPKVEIGPDTNLIGLLDSTGVVELTVWIESQFGFSVEIDDITPENFGTVRNLSNWIRKNTSKPAE
jgi:acyl carrier protein